MIVADLIRLLKTCDPNAIVLIPRDGGPGDATERVAEAASIPAERFAGGPAATHGALRLLGLPATVGAEITAD
ncbi:hypothetical protein [Caulobacter endophyticus]|uniref:Uncharacterized protein n=1 Tax=Caulobacter endophyticus TaxID=2172652 RepID=A0A2T9JH04_9CAUL|nr:hypothetical protein [Caulobacter endophyticus]PVM82946.1 hypothetical protein DDF67_21910 [Caulobacter endophyticus]